MEPIHIIHEDENSVVINKPSGLVVHPFDFSTEVTLLDCIQDYLKTSPSFENQKILQDGRVVNLGGMVHKLDRETSGVLVYAKNKKTFDELASQFKEHTVKKIYHAVVEGIVVQDSCTIDAPLAREKKSYKQTVNPTEFRGELRNAITHVRVLKRFENTTLVELQPETGRTHQLRTHMAHIGHPIVGDMVYGVKDDASRLMLHAQSLTCTINQERKIFTAEYPKDFLCPH